FLYNDPATTHTYTLSLHDALPISPRDKAVEFGRSRLRVTWDDLPNPSIDAPLALFYGAGTLYNRAGKEYLVKGFPMSVRFDAERSEEHTSELQSQSNLVCRLLLEK